LLILGGLLVFAVAVLGGFFGGGRLAPDRLRQEVARHFEEAFGVPVALGDVQLRLSWGPPWLSLEILKARAVLEPAAPRAAVLTMPHLEADLDPVALLLGRVRTLRFRAEAPTLMLALAAFPPATMDATTRLFTTLDRAGAALERHPCALPELTAEEGRILVASEKPGDPPLLISDGIGLSFSCRALRSRSRGQLEAHLPPSGAKAAPANGRSAALSATLDTSHGSTELHLKLSGVDLAKSRPLGALLGIPARATGHVALDLLWTRRGDGPQAVVLTARGRGIAARLPIDGDAIHLHLKRPILRARLSATPGGLVLHEASLSQGSLSVIASGSLTLPPVAGARLHAQLALGEADIQHLGLLLEQLPEHLRRPALAGLSRVEAGHLDKLRVEVDTSVSGVAEILDSGLLHRPGETRLTLALDGAAVRVGESDRIEDLSGLLRFSGDRLLLENVRGSYRGQPLPRLDAELTGLSKLGSLGALRCLSPAPVPALPGVRRLEQWVHSRRHEPEQKTWQRLEVDADLLSHPVLGCAITNLSAEVRPGDGSLDFEVARGVWAGVPVQGDGHYVELEDGGRALAIFVRLGKPVAHPPTEIPSGAWARGRFATEATQLGRWKIRGARGDFALTGSHAELDRIDLLLTPDGILQGEVGVELGSGSELPFTARIHTEGISGANLVASAQIPKLHFGGRIHGFLTLKGHLEQGLSPLERAEGRLELHAREGYVNRDLPVVLALVAASRPFGPDEVGDRLEYHSLDLLARVKDGWIRSNTFTAEGPRLRAGAQAAVAVSGAHTLKGVVGLFFFPGLDSLIDRLPLINRVILGSNGNLVGAYFSLTGTWDEPKTRIIPIRSLASAPVVNGLGGLVWRGIKRIESVLTRKRHQPLPDEEQAGS